MKLPSRSVLAALGAIAILGGVLGWRAWQDEDSLTAQPLDDAQAWQRTAVDHFQQNRFAEAAEAYRKAVDADPESAVLWSSLGEAIVMASQDDPMPADAKAAFERALELDSADPRARYFMAVSKDLGGDHAGAIADWLALLADTPPGAPWESDLVRTIEQVAAINQIDVAARIASASEARNILPSEALAGAAANGRGPTAEQIAAASSIPPSEQQNMAEGMVARLAARLEGESDDVDGWIMLMRSYKQLGRDDDARSALDRAIAANPAARSQLTEAAGTLGVR